MKAHLKKPQLKSNPLFSFNQKDGPANQHPSDPTLTITVTGATIFTILRKSH